MLQGISLLDDLAGCARKCLASPTTGQHPQTYPTISHRVQRQGGFSDTGARIRELGWHYLSHATITSRNTASLVLRVLRRVKEHHAALHSLPLLKSKGARQVVPPEELHTMLCYTVLYYTTLYYTLLHYTYYIILHFIIHNILYARRAVPHRRPPGRC